MVVLVVGFKLRGLTEPFFSAPQNGQILFISVEQLSLNVADDSAKTLSVLGNMGDFLDDCLLRFLQRCRRPPQKYPRFWGPTDFFKILPKKDPYRNHTKWMN